MTLAKIKIGGVWIDTVVECAAKFDDEWTSYGPDTGGGVVTEKFSFPLPPTLPSLDDGSDVTVGTSFTTTAEGIWVGNEIFTPTSPADVYALAFNEDTEQQIRLSAMVPQDDVPAGSLLQIMFTEPTAITSGVNYLAAYYSRRYAASTESTAGWPRTTTHMTTRTLSQHSRWGYVSLGAFPSNTTSATYHVTPIVQFPE